jgi:acyl carrier protein
MLPSAFVVLDALPLTPNGKVDRRALKAPENLRPELTAAYQSPQSEMEKTIAQIWQQVLHLKKVGVHDNFFDLGGHSLLIIQVKNKLQEIFNRDVLITDLFKYPNISSLANYLSQEENQKKSFKAVSSRVEKQKAAISQQKQIRNFGK